MRRLKLHTGRCPFVSFLNTQEEEIVVHNPRNMAVAMEGWYVHDESGAHRFNFPFDFMLPGNSSVVIYACPGKYLPAIENRPDLHLMWKTEKGTSRKAEVLNNEGETIYLKTPQDSLASRMTVSADDEVLSPYTLSAVVRFGLPHDVVLWLTYVRVALELAACYALVPIRPTAFMGLWLAAVVVDCLVLECGRSGCCEDAMCHSLSVGADKVRALTVFAALVVGTPAAVAADSWLCTALPVLLVTDALSQELHRYRSSLAPYRDTLDVLLQGSVFLPNFTAYAAEVYVLLHYAAISGMWPTATDTTPVWLPLVLLVAQAGFFLNHALSLVQLVDASSSIAKR